MEITLFQKKQRRARQFLLALFILLLFTCLVSLKVGAYTTNPLNIIKGLLGKADDPKVNIIMQNNRLPRLLTTLVAGAGLGLSGCVLQAILRNPLASASTLGVSQGASFGAAFAIVVLGLGAENSLGIPLLAFIGSISVAIIILALSKLQRVTPETIVLAGVAISAIFGGATTLIQYFANEVQLASLVYWTFGDLGASSWSDIQQMALLLLAFSLFCFYHRWDYNALLSGQETATSLGLSVERLTIINMFACCLMASVIVSHVGLISFVGLVAPHMVRLILGNNHIYLIPGSLLAGSVVLLLSDCLARFIMSPIILPIGTITSFLGGPLFLYLLFQERGRR